MLGRNEMHLNGATMQIIVQEWMDRQIGSSVRVTDVSTEGQGRYDGITFVVKFESVEPDKAA